MTKITMSLPRDAPVRLIKLLNSQTAEGQAARKALGVKTATLLPVKGDSR